MQMRKAAKAMAMAAVLLLCLQASQAAASVVSPRLERAITSGGAFGGPNSAGDDRWTIWVRFADKGLAGPQLDRALVAASAGLTAEARARRARADLGAGAVDQHDLPVAEAYVQAVAATGAHIRQRSRWLNAVSVAATADQIASLARLPFVTGVDQVAGSARSRGEVRSEFAEDAGAKSFGELDYGASLPGLEQISVPALHQRGLSGKGVTVAVFDTGFNLGHECFAELDVAATWDFVNGDADVGEREGEDLDQLLYGTADLSILGGFRRSNVIGAAYGASYILAKVEDVSAEYQAEEDNWVAALEWAEGLGADIVCSVLGYYYWYEHADLDGATAASTVAAEMAAARGVCVITSAGGTRGNETWPYVLAPADGRRVIAVGSCDANGQITYFSSQGPTYDGRIKPDVLALGNGAAVALGYTDDWYYYGYGANFSVPYVAGAVALMLESAPHLSPAQVATALRETGSRASLPDNDYGWGVIDAAAALGYWAPVVAHEPLADTEGGLGPHRVQAAITSDTGLDPQLLQVAWRRQGESWTLTQMLPLGGDEYAADIPPQSRTGTVVEYYIVAGGANGATTQHPADAPAAFHTFRVGADVTPPVMRHIGLADQTVAMWPPRLIVEASDNLAVAAVEVSLTTGGGFLGPFALELVDGRYELDFPLNWWEAPAGTKIDYILTARDAAETPNLAFGGPYTFRSVADRGRILVVDDRAGTKDAPASASEREAGSAAPAADKTAADLAGWLTDAGFVADVMQASAVNAGDFDPYDAVLVTCGANFGPFSYKSLRRVMQMWALEGGRLVVEGGETAYAVAERPVYPELLGDVLHIRGYAGEDGAVLRTPAELADHALVNRPHRLASPFVVNNSDGQDWSAADLAEAADDAFVALQAGYGTGRGGVIVHDDNTGPDAGQTVYLPFNLARAPETDARRLLENIFVYLLYDEPAGPSSISGRVILAGREDHSGVTVRNGMNQSTTTAADGSFTLSGLWGGQYTITAEAEGFAPSQRSLFLAEGETYDDASYYLLPVVAADYPQTPGLAIPDNDPGGVTLTVEVAEAGQLLGIDVDMDINHYSIGHLVVTLTSPSGTTVTLHNRTGETTDDLIGNWPGTLFVDGPGELSDFVGPSPQGAWTLHVSDNALGAIGTLNAWSLNLLVTPSGATAVEGGETAPRATRLVGNAPNPFNPRTVIAFEMAAPGRAVVEVFDVRGRLVAGLADGAYAAGRHELVWDGRTTAGEEAASGLYFSRLRTDAGTQVHKMTLVR